MPRACSRFLGPFYREVARACIKKWKKKLFSKKRFLPIVRTGVKNRHILINLEKNIRIYIYILFIYYFYYFFLTIMQANLIDLNTDLVRQFNVSQLIIDELEVGRFLYSPFPNVTATVTSLPFRNLFLNCES